MFFRTVLVLLVSILLISLLRTIIGAVMRGFTGMLKGSPAPEKARGPEVPAAGELKKDPVCGTYVSTATSFKTAAPGGTVYFCSAECRGRYGAGKSS